MGPRLHTSAAGPDHGVRPLHRFVIAFDGIDSETELHFTRILHVLLSPLPGTVARCCPQQVRKLLSPKLPERTCPHTTHSVEMLVTGIDATIHGLQSRADLNGSVVILHSWIAASGRWKVRTDAGEIVALKPECLSIDTSVPPKCQALWRSSPPSNPKRRVQILHHTLGQIAFEANQAFVDAGGVAAVVQIAFGAWPEGGLAASRHWADAVVEVAPHVFHSARRVSLSALADMAPEGEPYVSALVSNALFRDAFAPVAASLLGNYRWRQPHASMCCPHDHDQQQYMAERLVNIANCTLSRWACSSAIPRSAWACESTSRLLTSAPSPLPKSTLPSSSVAWM